MNFLEQREGVTSVLGESFGNLMPVNVRTLNGVDLKGSKVNRVDGKSR